MTQLDPGAEVRSHFAAQHPPEELVEELLDEARRHQSEASFSWLLPLLAVGALFVISALYAAL